MKPPVERLFVAIDPSEAAREALAAVSRGLAGARWTRREQLHVTLRFLGSVELSAASRIAQSLRAVDLPAFDVEAAGFGVFPSFRAPRILWTGLSPAAPLARLHDAVEARIEDAVEAPAGSPVPAGEKPFSPHLTIARLDGTRGCEVREWIAGREPFSSGRWRVGSFALYASTLTPSGAIHRTIETYPLAAAPEE